jgi:hypothetical protein
MKEAIFMALLLAGLYVAVTMSFKAGQSRGYGICVAESDDDYVRRRTF